jgi:hypothetical protein
MQLNQAKVGREFVKNDKGSNPTQVARQTNAPPNIDLLIREVRGHRVILDADLARNYEVSTKALNQAVKRHTGRFPEDFLFKLTGTEVKELKRSQIVTGSQRHRNPRFQPFAFTEHGAIMVANILNSPRAVYMSVFVVRAFVKMRSAFGDSHELVRKLALLEQELKTRLNVHETAIVDVLQRIMRILDPPPLPPEPPSPEIGFHVKDKTIIYRIKRRAPLDGKRRHAESEGAR